MSKLGWRGPSGKRPQDIYGLRILVTLAMSPGDIIWVVILYVAIQVLQNTVLFPRIHNHSTHIHPAIMMVVTVSRVKWLGCWAR